MLYKFQFPVITFPFLLANPVCFVVKSDFCWLIPVEKVQSLLVNCLFFCWRSAPKNRYGWSNPRTIYIYILHNPYALYIYILHNPYVCWTMDYGHSWWI